MFGIIFRIVYLQYHFIFKKCQFLSDLDSFYSFCCLIGIARTSRTLLNYSGKSWHPFHVSDFRGNAFRFSLLSMLWAEGLSNMAFIMLRNIPSIPNLLRSLIINGCWFCQMLFSPIFLLQLIWYIVLIDFQILNHSCVPGVSPTWLWYVILLMYHWILFANILLRIFSSILSASWACSSPFLWCFCWFW